MKKNIFFLAKTDDQASHIVNRLQNEGFTTESISFLAFDRDNRFTRKSPDGKLEANPEYFNRSPDYNEEPEFQRKSEVERRTGRLGHEANTKAPEGAATGATAGGIIGGTLGLLVGLGALAIPGFGPFIAAGPIMAALAGSAVGGGLGLLIGALSGLGIPEYEAKEIEKGVKEGHILMCVEANDADVDKVKKILKNEGATHIYAANEKVSAR